MILKLILGGLVAFVVTMLTSSAGIGIASGIGAALVLMLLPFDPSSGDGDSVDGFFSGSDGGSDGGGAGGGDGGGD
ncbi:MAG: hypothetical protein HQL33_09045 [Alphaproteobacteria bacterium]|nr:hypothetical protein [Alphaproteobacteria bacterium]